jgi:hypothetical protein
VLRLSFSHVAAAYQTFLIRTFLIQTFLMQTFSIQTFLMQTFSIQTFLMQTFIIQIVDPISVVINTYLQN